MGGESNSQAGLEQPEGCLCLNPETHFCGFERRAIGIDEHYGEVSIWTCKRCSRDWLHYFIEYEHLTAAGRMFSGVIPPETARAVRPDTAVGMFESMPWYFRGGSAFGRKLLRTTGPLTAWLVPFPGK